MVTSEVTQTKCWKLKHTHIKGEEKKKNSKWECVINVSGCLIHSHTPSMAS